jgi:hypothetical protein
MSIVGWKLSCTARGNIYVCQTGSANQAWRIVNNYSSDSVLYARDAVWDRGTRTVGDDDGDGSKAADGNDEDEDVRPIVYSSQNQRSVYS